MSDNSTFFDIPIVLIIFKRAEKSVLIIDQIAKVRPKKIYLIGDGPRNDAEAVEVEKCRLSVEEHITWPCEIIKNYAPKNRGVYENIAGGAKWVFEREEKAIFLEDDNFPAVSFFEYCRELLHKYKDDTRILWICGTNYMGKTTPVDGSDYVFTQLMLPCGWASWSHKFTRFYDGDITLYRNHYIKDKLQQTYSNRLMYEHDYPAWDGIIYNLEHGCLPNSWDYQMAFAIRINNLFGIAPKHNLISNIGADIHSIHGGNSMNLEMTSRFCEVPIFEMNFPLKHPDVVMIDPKFESATEKIIILPLKHRIRGFIVRCVKRILGINKNKSIRTLLKP